MEDLVGINVNDQVALTAAHFNPMTVMSDTVSHNRDGVTTLLKDLKVPETVQLTLQGPPTINPAGGDPIPGPTLTYEAQTYLEI